MIVSLWPSFQFVIDDKAIKEYYEKYLCDNTTTVKQGQWIDKYWTTEDDWGCYNHHTITCSICKEEYNWKDFSISKSNYCPHCGAKMYIC